MTSRNFETALKKGEIGERIVKSLLEENGWVVYQPSTNGAHCFDMLTIKNKENAIAVDVKAKARMNKWPATGINQRNFEEYTKFSQTHNMPFWLFFVDEMIGKIYGNSLEELEKIRFVEGKRYPFTILTRSGQAIRLWPIQAMIDIAAINENEIKVLVCHNQRSHDFTIED